MQDEINQRAGPISFGAGGQTLSSFGGMATNTPVSSGLLTQTQ